MKGDADEIAQKLDQHQSDMELSHGYAASTTMEANLTEGWNQFVADPNNKGLIASGTAAQAYMDQVVKPSVQSFGQGFQTREGKRFASEETARIQQNLFTRTAGEQSALTGQVWQANAQQTQNNFASSVLQDPSDTNVSQALALNEKFATETMPAGVTGEARARLTEEFQTAGDQKITFAAYLGQIEAVKQQYAQGNASDAEAGVRQSIASQKWFQYLSPEQQADIGPRLDEAVRSGQEQFRVGQASDKAQVEEATKAQIGQIRASLLPNADGSPPDPKAAQAALDKLHLLSQSTNPVIAATAGAEAESIGSVIRTQADDRLKGTFTPDDPAALASINQAVGIGPGQPGELTKGMLDDMRIAHRISDTTYQEQTKRLDDLTNNPMLRQTESRLTDFMRTAIETKLTHGAADPTGSVVDLFASTVDPRGKAAFGIALNQTMSQFESLVHNGHSPDEAYKMLTDPGSQNSVWNVMSYWQQVAQNGPGWAAGHPTTFGQAPASSPNAVPTLSSDTAKVQATGPIKPGESWVAYKARAGIN